MTLFFVLKKNVDFLISIAVFTQSFLIILQAVMIDVLGMNPDATTIYRAIFSAIPMSLAIIYSFRRRPGLFIKTYFIIIAITLIHSIAFPRNVEFIMTEGMRFFFPMVIPSALCLMTVRDLKIVEKSLYYVSILTLVLVVLYVAVYFSGGFIIEKYNMSFSYGCLLPMVSFYRQRTFTGYSVSVFFLIVIIAIGSRGAAMVFMAYVIYDIFQYKKKYSILLFGLLIIGFITLPLLAEWLESIGIHSRTLNLLANDAIDKDSGRGYIYDMFYNILDQYPNFGVGLFGDRVYLNGVYCHNIFLEMILNWGYIGVMILWPILFTILLFVFTKCKKEDKNRMICYTLVLIGPLMASGSYLTNPNFGIYCAIIYLLYKKSKIINVTYVKFQNWRIDKNDSFPYLRAKPKI